VSQFLRGTAFALWRQAAYVEGGTRTEQFRRRLRMALVTTTAVATPMWYTNGDEAGVPGTRD
jgi:hypothetical protein